MRSILPVVVTIAALGAAALLAGCGGSEAGSSSSEAPDPAAFPSAGGKTIGDLLAESDSSDYVLSPVGQAFRVGENRYAFGVFELDRSEVSDAEVAIYLARGEDAPVKGPFPARIESMETRPAFESLTTSQAEHAAKVVYVVEGVELNAPGEWRAVGLVRDGGGLQAGRLPSIVVGAYDEVPDVGEPAPRVHTPTPESVGGDLTKIDTRRPPTDMHADLAEVLGERPVVLLFATPQLCQSRVCGPVVDVMAQVQAETGDGVEFIHMEIYNDNDPSQGLRPPVRRYNLPTEPWLFVIDAHGRIVERIEGPFGLSELREAVRRVSSSQRSQGSGT